MKTFFLKIILYSALIFIMLEIAVRVLHLYNEFPTFIINDHNVKTYAPNQNGYTVTGNRVMNFAEYNINKSGFNSFREFVPTDNKTEVAIIGDSFIEGLHQNYYNSISKKVEQKLKDSVDVFQYGHSGYDFADQLHLVSAYKEKFEMIDYIIYYMKFENDLKRDFYEPDQYWVDSQYFLTRRIGKKLKLFNYINTIGLMEPLRNLRSNMVNNIRNLLNPPHDQSTHTSADQEEINLKYLGNFKKLIEIFGFDKTKTAILLDSRTTSKSFLDYCDSMGYRYIDFSKELESSKIPTTLIYDMHWNNHGRDIIARVIANYIKEKERE